MAYDVHCRNVGNLVHGDVVVHDSCSVFALEERLRLVAKCAAPKARHDIAGILARIVFVAEERVGTAHHVEQYAVTWTIALRKVLSPIAATQAPVAAVLRLFAPIGCAVVLGIEAYEVHADSRWQPSQAGGALRNRHRCQPRGDCPNGRL